MISAKKTPEKSRYPVHYLVWHNKHRQLEKELAANEQVRDGAVKPVSPDNHRAWVFIVGDGREFTYMRYVE